MSVIIKLLKYGTSALKGNIPKNKWFYFEFFKMKVKFSGKEHNSMLQDRVVQLEQVIGASRNIKTTVHNPTVSL